VLAGWLNGNLTDFHFPLFDAKKQIRRRNKLQVITCLSTCTTGHGRWNFCASRGALDGLHPLEPSERKLTVDLSSGKVSTTKIHLRGRHFGAAAMAWCVKQRALLLFYNLLGSFLEN
jgi:hypothetical protein